MKDFIDSDGGDRRALDGTEKNAAKRVSNRLSIAPLKGFEHELTVLGLQVKGGDVWHIFERSWRAMRLAAGSNASSFRRRQPL